MNRNTDNQAHGNEAAAVDVLARVGSFLANEGHGKTDFVCALRNDFTEARAAVAELVAKSERVATTLELPKLARQSTKNANAGFIDWRDWCALKGEVMELRAALSKFSGVAL